MSKNAGKKYSDKLRDPRWQKRRLQIMERDGWMCQRCLDDATTLNVHHRWYEAGKEPWEYEDDALVTLCENCHNIEYETRRDREARLLHVLRRRFFAPELDALADAFHYMARVVEPEIFVAALDHFLIEHSNVQKMAEAYLIYRAEREAGEHSGDDGEDEHGQSGAT